MRSWECHMRPLGSHPGETPQQHCLRFVNIREKVGEGLKAMLFSVRFLFLSPAALFIIVLRG